MILIIDNYDSFTFNLVHYFKELGEKVEVSRNDSISCDDIDALSPDQIVISPGPGAPDDAGISLQVVERFKGQIPILGVCLGHQVIAQSFGAKIIRAKQVVHGKTSILEHSSSALFQQLPQHFKITRYHSLTVDEFSVPDCLNIDAWVMNTDGSTRTVMGLSNQQLLIYGIQFHPEAFLTENGHRLLQNFLNTSRKK